MKKTLLLAAAVFAAATMWAETTETLIYTYDYNTWPSDDPTPVTLNSTQAPYLFTDLSTYWSTDTGFMAVNGGQLSSTYPVSATSNIGNSMTTVDFGGNIGKTLCINGSSSGFVSYISSTYNVTLSATSGLQAGWLNFSWAFPPTGDHKVSQDGTSKWMRVKVYLNVFSPTSGGDSSTSIFSQGVDIYNGYNTNQGALNKTAVYSSSFFNDGVWMPNYWMVYTVEDYMNEGGSLDSAIRLRTGAGAYSSYAIFIQKIEIYYCTGDDGCSATPSYTLDTTSYTYDFSTPTGIASIDAEADNTPVNVYNLSGVLVRQNVLPSEATLDLTPGFYIVGNQKVIVK